MRRSNFIPAPVDEMRAVTHIEQATVHWQIGQAIAVGFIIPGTAV